MEIFSFSKVRGYSLHGSFATLLLRLKSGSEEITV
jgi:hypothetical protein